MCYVLTFGRSVTAFSVPPRSQRPGQMPRSPHPKAGPDLHIHCNSCYMNLPECSNVHALPIFW
jgi:hypothetical protein